MHARTASRHPCIVLGALALAACGDGATASGRGALTLSLEAEETIAEGLAAGDGDEDVTDGWTVTYDRFLLAVGRARAASTDADVELADDRVLLLDLTALPAGGVALLEVEDAEAVRYDQVSFENPVAEAGIERGRSVSAADVEQMIDGGYSIFVEGELTKADGESCAPADPSDCLPAPSVRFAWGGAAATRYEHCGPEEGDLGLAVPSGGSGGGNFSIHGDHWFFNRFPEGSEVVMRRAQWVADADLDRDGETTVVELQETVAADVLPSASYSLAGSPIPVRTAYDYFVAQAHTLGHFQGEGECEWKVTD